MRSSPLATRGTRKAVTSKRSWNTGTSLLFSRTGQRCLKREGKSTLSKEGRNFKVGFRCSGRRGRANITFLHSFDLESPPSVIESCTPSRKFLDVRSDHHV